MSLFRTLNALRRDTLGLALQTLGLQSRKGPAHQNAPTLFRTFDTAAAPRAGAAPLAQLLMPTPMQVRAVVRETPDAVSLVLARTDGQAIHFKPGMFFTVLLTIDGQEYRRAYSACSAAQETDTITLTVKRVVQGGVKGLVSHWINEQLAVGDTLRVLGPSGSFVLEPSPTRARVLLLVAGGSGITPLMSIIRTVLVQEPGTRMVLLYGNRSKKDIIFLAALNALCKAHPTRLVVTHILEKPPKNWAQEDGRLDATLFSRHLDGVLEATALADLEVYTCGPAPMMDVVAHESARRGVLPGHFHQEKFTPAAGSADVSRFTAQTVAFESGGQSWTAQAAAGQTLLEAGLAHGAPMLFSCTLGGCGRCRVKVTEGEVDMPEPNCLLPHEKAQGYALSCIARPCSAVRCTIDPPQAH